MTPREFKREAGEAGPQGERQPWTRRPLNALGAYYRLLEFWNEKVNLTAFSLKDAPDEAIDRLLIEPLVAARHLHGVHGQGTARNSARTRACSTSAPAAGRRQFP
ncbi:MAG: hypothetical protein M0C28_46535 [Candidatus Moduliflexus flocculans]|nr:hypothetical protein [Candidatus Moduliflexus flocculans]